MPESSNDNLNFASLSKLSEMGMSETGKTQLSKYQIMTDPKDREILHRYLALKLNSNGELQLKYTGEGGTFYSPTISFFLITELMKLGMSAQAGQQIWMEKPVTNAEERKKLFNLFNRLLSQRQNTSYASHGKAHGRRGGQ